MLTPIPLLLVLSNSVPPDLHCKEALLREYHKIMSSPNMPILQEIPPVKAGQSPSTHHSKWPTNWKRTTFLTKNTWKTFKAGSVQWQEQDPSSQPNNSLLLVACDFPGRNGLYWTGFVPIWVEFLWKTKLYSTKNDLNWFPKLDCQLSWHYRDYISCSSYR